MNINYLARFARAFLYPIYALTSHNGRTAFFLACYGPAVNNNSEAEWNAMPL